MNREILASDFAAATPRNRWKTFVLEAHPDNGVEQLLTDAFADSKVEATDDVYIHHLAGEGDFVVDHLDQRFWSIHTTSPTGDAAPYLRRVVNQRRDLDCMWLPSDHLRGIWSDVSPHLVVANFRAGRLTSTSGELDDLKLRVSGHAADQVLRAIGDRFQTDVPQSQVGINVVDEHFGSITEFVSHDGRFMASGGDFGFHQAIVQRVVDRYRRSVEGAERRALRWVELPEGGARLQPAYPRSRLLPRPTLLCPRAVPALGSPAARWRRLRRGGSRGPSRRSAAPVRHRYRMTTHIPVRRWVRQHRGQAGVESPASLRRSAVHRR